MHTLKKTLMGLAALAALALGGATIAGATGGRGDGDGEKADDGPDKALTGAAATKAGAAAVKAVGGGRFVSVERSDEGGAAVYEVKVAKAGKVTEVQLDASDAVTSQKADDDHASGSEDTGDGDGETADDAAGADDKGDGDGEHADR